MKTLNKALAASLLKEWIFFIGFVQITNALAYLLTKHELIEGPIWQVVFPALIMLMVRLIPRYNNWLDKKLS